MAQKRKCSPFVIDEYFAKQKNTIEELVVENQPDRIRNLDETSFCIDPSKTKVVRGKTYFVLELLVLLSEKI